MSEWKGKWKSFIIRSAHGQLNQSSVGNYKIINSVKTPIQGRWNIHWYPKSMYKLVKEF